MFRLCCSRPDCRLRVCHVVACMVAGGVSQGFEACTARCLQPDEARHGAAVWLAIFHNRRPHRSDVSVRVGLFLLGVRHCRHPLARHVHLDTPTGVEVLFASQSAVLLEHCHGHSLRVLSSGPRGRAHKTALSRLLRDSVH